MFINPNIKDINISKKISANCVELHTGRLSRLIKKNKSYARELQKIKRAVSYGTKIGLEIHAGHGMDYKTAEVLSKIKDIKEFNIGHFIIGESIFFGLTNIIKNLKKIIKKKL